MYITVNDVIGEKRIDLAYPIQGKEVAVVIMQSENVQYLLKEPVKLLLKTELSGLELKSRMDSRDYVLKENKLKNVTKMVISLDKLDNPDNLEDGRPSNTLLMYCVSSPKYFTRFEPSTPQYKILKNDKIVSLTLRITDQNTNVITNGLGTTAVLHIR